MYKEVRSEIIIFSTFLFVFQAFFSFLVQYLIYPVNTTKQDKAHTHTRERASEREKLLIYYNMALLVLIMNMAINSYSLMYEVFEQNEDSPMILL